MKQIIIVLILLIPLYSFGQQKNYPKKIHITKVATITKLANITDSIKKYKEISDYYSDMGNTRQWFHYDYKMIEWEEKQDSIDRIKLLPELKLRKLKLELKYHMKL